MSRPGTAIEHKNPWVSIENSAGDSTATVRIYGAVGDWYDGLDAASVAKQISAIDAKEINVRINSPGGDAFAGIAIYNALRAHTAKVIVVVDGLAASAASVIAMAGDEIVMGTGSQVMIHQPFMYTAGQAADLRADADRLDKMTESLIDVYATRSQSSRDYFREAVEAETWYTADEAVEAGLADRVDRSVSASDLGAVTASIKNFRYSGRENAPEPRMPVAKVAEAPTRKESAMSTLIEGLRERLGIAEDADEATVLAALDAALAGRAEGQSIEAHADVVAVDRSRFAEMQSQLAEFAAYRAQQEAAAEEAYLTQAMADGKFPPARLSHYRDLLKAAPEQARALIDGMPKNVIPVEEIGHDGDGVHVDEFTAKLTAAADKVGFAGLDRL
ncbi:ATP-dependent Clp protease proteolytic subunit [Rhodococcus sp. CX]|uniref:head maturation protease, ClpP-related n=1 Tax=Rhodococcus sp. CX TaxID=2789880 RepID=UPI0018CF906E|nr:head maturation protease, ClpP-related [Rhodococcus sp. CX]MBH0121552.1 ATP-dependent Clp protease proteolytic subunit [Rhodococcus sp. CX]